MDIQENIRVLEEEILKLSVEKMTPSLAQNLNTYFGAKSALESVLYKNNKNISRNQNEDIQEVAVLVNADEKELLPTLKDFRQNHTEHNLQKLCLEIQEFCISIYSTLQNQEEKNIYSNMIKNLTTF